MASEVGLTEARRMPVEIRHWWIEQMQNEAKQRKDRYEELSTGKKTVPVGSK